MEYLEYRIQITPLNPIVNDILAAELGELGFESFTDSIDGIWAYIATEKQDESAINQLLAKQKIQSTLQFTIKRIADQNWNEEWEKNYFQPIVISDLCVIHSSFHTDVPQAKYGIVIDPKMAFGTGHHETTSLMLEQLLELQLEDKSFLDMGCGTAVLAILASMKGAKDICGIDIDQWAINNALENIRLNQTPEIQILTGGADLLNSAHAYDIIFANINRNILLEDMPAYVNSMHEDSLLYMSGFYESDLAVIREKAESLGLKYQHHVTKNQWTAVRFEL
jgi:ribosomal protein L11 methyltransferase